MTFAHVQAVFHATSGDPDKATVNNWYCKSNDVGSPYTGVQQFLTHLNQLYNVIGGNIWAEASRPAAEYKVYDLALPKPNPPVFTAPITLGAPAGTNTVKLPGEVALVGSFTSAAPSGSKPARRRGRVYFGPFIAEPIVANYSRPWTGLQELFRTAFGTLLGNSNTSTLYDWCTFSKTDAGGWLLPGGVAPPDLVAAMHPVLGGWVDDEWDTQRRRGLDSTSRLTFGTPQSRAREFLGPELTEPRIS